MLKFKYNRQAFSRSLVFIVLVILVLPRLECQITINEFCASNSFTIEDPDFDESADWVELFNAGSQPVNLKGYYLSDNFNSPEKWQILEDAVITPGGFLMIWSDGRNNVLHSGFKLSAAGEELVLSNPGLVLLDSISFTAQMPDISYGRNPDGNTKWSFFKEPTPGAANDTPTFDGIVFNLPSFSLRGGMYSGAQTLELDSEFGGEIRYTTDGSEPGPVSVLYSDPILIASTMVIRARIFRPGMIGGPVITQSYFINENSYGGRLPVVSIASDPGNFWDPVNGIYVQDYKPDWEVPVNIELFENNGLDRAAFNQRAGVKINGLHSWQLPQKMLGVYFRKAYGSGNLDYRLTPQRKRLSYKNFALRASGSDWSYTLIRDILSHHAASNDMNLDVLGFKPAVVFINGEYQGIHNIREKVDADYIEKSFGLDKGSFDMVENQETPEAGDMAAYKEFQGFLSADLSVQANFDIVAGLADIENFTDYVITEMAVRNTSIDHNVMSWKPKESGKWKWILVDLDRGYFKAASSLIDYYIPQRQLILQDLFENQGYREYFAQRLASHLFTTFNSERMETLIDDHEGLIEDEMPRHIQRWYGTTSSYGNAMPSESYWREQVCDLGIFVDERPSVLLANLQQYGFSGICNLALDCNPGEAGKILINSLKTAGPFSYGPFIMDMETHIEAMDNPGYDFEGWYDVPAIPVIPAGSVWKYRDNGIDPGTGWTEAGYDDAAWSQGPAELGYGDGDEKTVISYGGNSFDKYITTWFRKSFDVTSDLLQDGVFLLSLLRDDGAVVYLNGEEVFRLNLPCGTAGPGTLAETAIENETERVFICKRIDNSMLNPGTNVLAVEVHQNSSGSSDISFDLALSCYLPDSGTLLTPDPGLTLEFTGDRFLSAGFNRNSDCIIPEMILSDMTLSVECSPYLVLGDVTVAENATLNIDPGVEILMHEGGNLFVHGKLVAEGNAELPVIFRLNPAFGESHWGGLVFRNTTESSSLRYVSIEDASEGPDPVLENAAITAFNANLDLDHITIEKVHGNPIISRYSDITLTNSSLHSEVTGDLINVKYGRATIENCSFTGNEQLDADAIDFDEVDNGIIRNSVISGFYGFNSDAIDLGEEALDVLVDSMVIFNIRDKGVSLGQNSSALVRNSIFLNCNMGVAVKDSSTVRVLNCIFYGTGTPVACYEKTIGLAGGNARVINSILSNSSDASFMADNKSNIFLEYSLSDNRALPAGSKNLFGNPGFSEPSFFDFSLAPSSPAKGSGYSVGGPVDMGTFLEIQGFQPVVMISQIFLNGSSLDLPQFIALYNPSGNTVDLSGFAIDKGVTATIPAGTSIGAGDRIYLTDDAGHSYWEGVPYRIIRWTEGKLSGNGESLRLVGPQGIVLDYLVYSDLTWPSGGFLGDFAFTLVYPALDNHFSENWTTEKLADAVGMPPGNQNRGILAYPNPTKGPLHIEITSTPEGLGTGVAYAQLYDLRGHLICMIPLESSETLTLNLANYGAGVYLLRIGPYSEKIMVVE